jgi:tellurium resistance protein TerD
MSNELEMGARVNLATDSPLAHVIVGLGWDEAGDLSSGIEEHKGVLGTVLKEVNKLKKKNVDLDLSCFELDENDRFQGLVYFNNALDISNSIKLTKDDKKGHHVSSNSDAEVLYIDLLLVKPVITKLDIWVTIHDSEKTKMTFGDVKNAFIRIVDRVSGSELFRYTLSGNAYAGSTAIKFGTLYRHAGAWKFNAAGEGSFDTSLTSIQAKYNTK